MDFGLLGRGARSSMLSLANALGRRSDQSEPQNDTCRLTLITLIRCELITSTQFVVAQVSVRAEQGRALYDKNRVACTERRTTKKINTQNSDIAGLSSGGDGVIWRNLRSGQKRSETDPIVGTPFR